MLSQPTEINPLYVSDFVEVGKTDEFSKTDSLSSLASTCWVSPLNDNVDLESYLERKVTFNLRGSSTRSSFISTCDDLDGRRASCCSFDHPILELPEPEEEEVTPLEQFAVDHSLTKENWTTVMVRHIPCRYTQEELFIEVEEMNIAFNFLYLPPARRSIGNLGYAFINFLSRADAEKFIANFTGHSFRCQPNSKKRAEVIFAKLQGFQENVEFYSSAKVSKSKYRPFIDLDLN
jgi:hypothetical protein